MTDACDRAEIEVERELAECLRQQALKAATSAREPCGYCYNCDAEVLNKLFCDGDCRDDFEQRARALKNKGVGNG